MRSAIPPGAALHKRRLPRLRAATTVLALTLAALVLAGSAAVAWPKKWPTTEEDWKAWPGEQVAREDISDASVWFKPRELDTIKTSARPDGPCEYLIHIQAAPGHPKYLYAAQLVPDTNDPEKDQLSDFQIFPDDQLRNKRTSVLSEDGTKSDVLLSEYLLRFHIGKNARPQKYDVALLIGDTPRKPGAELPKGPKAYFDVPVGVRGGNTPLTLALNKVQTDRIVAGRDGTLYFNITNNFPSYDVTIKGVTLRDSAGSIEEIRYDPRKPIDIKIPHNEQPTTLEVPYHARRANPFAVLRMIQGLSQKPTLYAQVYYEDGYRDAVETSPPFQPPYRLDFDPVTTLGWAAAGALTGWFVRWLVLLTGASKPGRSLFWMLAGGYIALGVSVVFATQLLELELVLGNGSPLYSSKNPLSAFVLAMIIGLNELPSVIRTILTRLGITTGGPGSGGAGAQHAADPAH